MNSTTAILDQTRNYLRGIHRQLVVRHFVGLTLVLGWVGLALAAAPLIVAKFRPLAPPTLEAVAIGIPLCSIATAIAIALWTRPTLDDAARALDARCGTKELFLTAVDRRFGNRQAPDTEALFAARLSQCLDDRPRLEPPSPATRTITIVVAALLLLDGILVATPAASPARDARIERIRRWIDDQHEATDPGIEAAMTEIREADDVVALRRVLDRQWRRLESDESSVAQSSVPELRSAIEEGRWSRASSIAKSLTLSPSDRQLLSRALRAAAQAQTATGERAAAALAEAAAAAGAGDGAGLAAALARAAAEAGDGVATPRRSAALREILLTVSAQLGVPAGTSPDPTESTPAGAASARPGANATARGPHRGPGVSSLSPPLRALFLRYLELRGAPPTSGSENR